MPHYNLAFIGFGNVGQALARLLIRKRSELRANHNINYSITGIATRSHGIAIDPDGIDLEKALSLMETTRNKTGNGKASPPLSRLSAMPVTEKANMLDFIRNCAGDVLFENSPVNYQTGQPAMDHLVSALENGMHAITANKGPVVHGYRRLTDLARSKGLKFFFESTVMDGAPIFSLFRETLPSARLLSFNGVLNSTTNLILTRMEAGETFDEAVQYAQSIGIAETDPSGDIDGWDAAVKVAALVTVLMGVPVTPDQVSRIGIRDLTQEDIRTALGEGKRWKLVCTAKCAGKQVEAVVAPKLVSSDSPLYSVSGTSSLVTFETDVLGPLSIYESDPGPETTAYGLFADFVNAVK
ncbi:MAG: homoserine dehydrogenase [Chloroflexi bacterium]|nr:MAG: homoserine dehydrogenase [Chloroflexota bacterium]